MKTDIWHLPDERPENNTMIIYPVGDVVMGGHIYDYTDWDLIKRNIKHWWMYQNDFLKTKEQSSKIERLEKALKIIKELANILRNLDDFTPIANARHGGDLIMDEVLRIKNGE